MLTFSARNYIFCEPKYLFMKTLITSILLSSTFLTLVSCSPSRPPVPVTGENAVHGKVIEASVNTVNIMTPQGKCYQFSTMDAQKNLKHGLKVDHRILVIYKGEIKGLDTQDTKVTSISDYNVW